jgi:hypothetical protein
MIPDITAINLDALARRALYTGSVEHKATRSWLGVPRLRKHSNTDPDDYRQNATVCPLVSEDDRNTATLWVQYAIRNRHFRADIWSAGFPREIWHKDNNGRFWFGRLTSGGGDDGCGEYKGWPISEREWHENFN